MTPAASIDPYAAALAESFSSPDDDLFHLALWAISCHVDQHLNQIIAAEVEFRRLYRHPNPFLRLGDGDGSRDTSAKQMSPGDGDVRGDISTNQLAAGDGDVSRDTLANQMSAGDGDDRRDISAKQLSTGDGDPDHQAALADPGFIRYLRQTTFTFTASQILALMRPAAEYRFWTFYAQCLTPSSVGHLFTKLGLPRSRTKRRRFFTITLPLLAQLIARHHLDLAAFAAFGHPTPGPEQPA